jgi:8-oxo-dGTP pyrophosphatase MutT (NUDIX family)
VSYGIILFRRVGGDAAPPEYLMIQRKNTFGYMDYIKGNYIHNNTAQLQIIIDEMSLAEKNKIKNSPSTASIKDVVAASSTAWEECEWEFPKGRKNQNERDIHTALREFEEETGISSKTITIIQNILPYEENFIGSNYKCYKNKFFLAHTMEDTTANMSRYQKSEVSKMEWKTYDDCMSCIRDTCLEKKQLLTKINTLLASGIATIVR